MKKTWMTVALAASIACGTAHAGVADALTAVPNNHSVALTETFYSAETAPDATSREVLSHFKDRLDKSDDPKQNGTPFAYHTGFGQIIEQNFARLNRRDARRLFDSLSDQELADIAYYYGLSNKDTGREGKLMDVLRKRLDIVRLNRMDVATAQAAAGFATKPKVLINGQMVRRDSGAMGYAGVGFPAVWLEYTPYEIYLDLRTAPIGAVGPAAALVQTGLVVGSMLYMSYQAGYSAGSMMAPLIEEYAPSVYNQIGQTLYVAVNVITTLSSIWDIGTAQQNYAHDYLSGPYAGLSSATCGKIETSGGDYHTGQDWEENYWDSKPGGGGTCWPFECMMQ
jgi:hypothetical protein